VNAPAMPLRRSAAVLLASLLGVLSAAGQVLNVPQKNQEKDQWCWAACTQAILSYYGQAYTQTAIAQYGTGGVNTWNYCYGSGTEGGVFRRGCNMILSYFGGIQSGTYSTSLSQATCQNEITGSRPVFINWTWSTGGGHFVVLKGLSGNTATVMDPWSGPTVNTFSWVQSGGGHTWSYSLRLTTSPLWAGAVDLGSGWRWLSWFGYFAPMGNGWIWHKQFGFVYCTGNDNSLWMWINDQGEWWWSTRTIYPDMYRARDNTWLFYQRDFDAMTAAARWFYNYSTGRWVYY
jgi:hypothetical protein